MAGARTRVVVAGTGYIARARHIPILQRRADVEVAAVVDRNAARGRQVAAQLRIPAAFESLPEALARGADAVHVCTPPWTHQDLASAALAAGAHVYCEKPMAMSVAGAEEMAARAAGAGRVLAIAHNFLVARSTLHARRLLADGHLGQLTHVYGFQLSNPRRRLPAWHHDLPGGLFFDECPHLLYLLRHFAGDVAVERVQARFWPGKEGREMRSLSATLHGAACPGSITMQFDAPVSEWFLVLCGTRRLVALDIFRDLAIELPNDGRHATLDVLRSSGTAALTALRWFVTSGWRHLRRDLWYGQDVSIGAFLDAVRGAGRPVAGAADGVAVVRLAQDLLDGAGVHPQTTGAPA